MDLESLPPEIQQMLKDIENIEPVETLSTAMTALKGESRCKFCKAQGLFSFSGVREWSHKKNCPWEVAKKILAQK